jgi:hypothetical protein
MRLEAGYKRRFETTDKEIGLKFSEQGISVQVDSEPRYLDQKYYQWAEELIALAYKLDGINLRVGGSNETRIP